MDIQLNLVNNSNDMNNTEYVIFQKNVATSFEELPVAWRVIKNLGISDNHPFTYPMEFTVGAADSWGNYTPQLDATNGQQFHMYRAPSGDVLAYNGPSASPTEVEVLNDLPQGSINANIYRNGLLLSQKTCVSPAQKATFQFKPTIWIGAASQIEQGKVINSAILSNINTEISLLGVASADIVITGGGCGPTATPFTFTLCNVTYA